MYFKFDTHTEATQAARQGQMAVVFSFSQTYMYLPVRYLMLADEDVGRLISECFRLGDLNDSKSIIVDEGGYCSLNLPTCWRPKLYFFDETTLCTFVTSLDRLG